MFFGFFLIYYVVIGKFFNVECLVFDFVIFVFMGLIVWGLFFEIILSLIILILLNVGLIKKVYIFCEIFFLVVVGFVGFNFFI